MILFTLLGREDIVTEIENINPLFEFLIGILLLLFYYIVFETVTQRTIGKYVTNTKVVKLDGSKPSIDEIILRTLSRIVPFEPFSFFGDKPIGWHDEWTDTVVVDIKKYEQELFKHKSFEELGQSNEKSE